MMSRSENIFTLLEKLFDRSPWTTVVHKDLPDGDISIVSGEYDFHKAKVVISHHKASLSDKEIEAYAALTNENSKILAQNSIDGALMTAPLAYKKKAQLIRNDHAKYDIDPEELRKAGERLEFSEAKVWMLQIGNQEESLKADSCILKMAPMFGDFSFIRIQVINGGDAVILGLQRFMSDGGVVSGYVYDAEVGDKEELIVRQESRREINLRDLKFFQQAIEKYL